MSTSTEDRIRHYQRSIERSLTDKERLMYCIKQLSRLPVTVSHLENTGIGRTVNSLRKLDNGVGDSARNLVSKWKNMVSNARSSNDEDEACVPDAPESYETPDYDSDSENTTSQDTSYNHNQSEPSASLPPTALEISNEINNYVNDKINEKLVSSENESISSKEESKDKSKSRSSGHSSKHSSKHSLIKDKRKDSDTKLNTYPKDKYSNSMIQNKYKSMKISKDPESTDTYDPLCYPSSSSSFNTDKSYSEDRKRKHDSNSDDDDEESRKKIKDSSSEEEEDDENEKDNLVIYDEESEEEKIEIDEEEEEDEDREDENDDEQEDKSFKEKKKLDKQSRKESSLKGTSHSDKSKLKEKHPSSSSHSKTKSRESNDQSKKNEKDEKRKNDKHHSKKSSKSKSSHSSSNSKDQSKYKDKDKDKDKNKSKHSKDKESNGKDRKSEKEQNCDKVIKDDRGKCKDKESKEQKESKEHKKSKEHRESKEQKDRHKDYKKQKNNEKKECKKDKKNSGDEGGIDGNSGTSFAEALGMCMMPPPSKKKKENTSFTPSKSVKSDRASSSSPTPSTSSKTKSSSRVKCDIPDSPEALPLLSSNVKLEPLDKINDDVDLASTLPEPSPHYRPLPQINHVQRKLEEDQMLSQVIYAKNQRTKVYSGNKSGLYTSVPTLHEMCIRILIENIEALEFTGGVPYYIIKPVLERATPDQLFMLEHHNPYLIEDTDQLWQFHCNKDFRTKIREEMESWREMYMRCLDEREAKLKALTANIKQSIDKSTPVRSTKLAYVDHVVKPPRNVLRQQAKYGTANATTKSSDLKKKLIAGPSGPSGSGLSSAERISVPPPPQARVRQGAPVIKKTKAPLMAKALQAIKGRYKR